MSPPRGIVRGGTVDVMFYARSPDYTLFHVRMPAMAFWEAPHWAFAATNGEPRHRLMRSFIAPMADPYPWRVDIGYVDLVALPWDAGKIMFSWYDKPALNEAGKTTLYSNILA